jgi:hypothetical protein
MEQEGLPTFIAVIVAAAVLGVMVIAGVADPCVLTMPPRKLL